MKSVLVGLEQEKDINGIVSDNEKCEYLGLEYVKAYSQQRGFDVQVLGESTTIEEVLRLNPEVVGFSVMTSNYEPSKKMSKQLKKINPHLPIIWGGPHATTSYYEPLKEGIADFVILGEGEKTFANLLDKIKNKENPSELEGLAFFDRQKIVCNPPQKRLTSEEIDSIDFRLIHSKDYASYNAKNIPHTIPVSDMKFSMISGSRGCWNDCSFCLSKTFWGKNITYRSPENVVNELEFLVKEKGINFVFFSDDDFLVNSNWTSKIAKEIIKRDIKTNYHIMGSIRSAQRFSGYDLLQKSGCCEITLGMESSTQRIIDDLGKGYSIKDLPLIAREITSHNIHLGLYYMLGYPDQTNEDLSNDFDFIKEIPFSRIRAVFLTPYPGTRLYNQVEKENLWREGYRNNWASFTNDTPVIKSKATPEQLIEARKKVLGLYFNKGYQERMNLMAEGKLESKQALKEFLEFMGGKIR